MGGKKEWRVRRNNQVRDFCRFLAGCKWVEKKWLKKQDEGRSGPENNGATSAQEGTDFARQNPRDAQDSFKALDPQVNDELTLIWT